MKTNISSRWISFLMSFLLLSSLAGCNRNNLSNIHLKETPATIITPAPNSMETAAVDDSEINRLEDMDKLDQVISIDEIKLTAYNYEQYSANAEYYLGVTDAPDDKFNYKIMYKSDDCEVAGYISAPADYLEKNYPILIFVRGGQGYMGKVSPGFLCFLADLGFITIATQYRGIDGGTGKDDFGGDDVRDVINLLDIAEQLPFGNGKIYMLGVSRGGIETYSALREDNLAGKDRISAAVVISGVSDLRAIYNVCEEDQKKVLRFYVGGTPEQVPEEYERRSAVCWPELIDTPLLICHGRTDDRAPVEQAETMYDVMMEQDKDVELILYDGGHTITPESNEYVFKWLRSH